VISQLLFCRLSIFGNCRWENLIDLLASNNFIIKKVKFNTPLFLNRTRGRILADTTLLYNPKKPKSLFSNGLHLQYKRFVDKKQEAGQKIGAKSSMGKRWQACL